MSRYIPKTQDNFSALVSEGLSGKDLDPNQFTSTIFRYLNESQRITLENQKIEQDLQYNRSRQERLDGIAEEQNNLNNDLLVLREVNDFVKNTPLSGVTPDLSLLNITSEQGNQIRDNMMTVNQQYRNHQFDMNNNYQNYLTADNKEARDTALKNMQTGLGVLKPDSALYKDMDAKHKAAIKKENFDASIQVVEDNLSTLGSFFGVPEQAISTGIQRIRQSGAAGNFDLAEGIFKDIIKTAGGNVQGQRELDAAIISNLGSIVTLYDKVDESYAITDANRTDINSYLAKTISNVLMQSNNSKADSGDTAANILRSDQYNNIYSEGKLVTLPQNVQLGSGMVLNQGEQIFAYIDKNGGNNMVTINPDGTPNFTNIIKFDDDTEYDALQGINL